MSVQPLLRKHFNGAALPRDFDAKPNVVVCFHGHTNSAADSAAWGIQPLFPPSCSFLYLNAPHRYHGGRKSFEWFAYRRDEGVDGWSVDPTMLGTVDQFMRTMNLHALKRDVLSAVAMVVELYDAIVSAGKNVYFVGTSQGAATSFTAALHILSNRKRSSHFRGGFFHHMAGVYASAFPKPLPMPVAEAVVVKRMREDEGGRKSKRMKKQDLHGSWLPEEEALLRTVAHAALSDKAPPRLVVALSLHDHVVPIALQRLLGRIFPRHRAVVRRAATAVKQAPRGAAAAAA